MLSRKFFFLTYTSPGNGCGETQESKWGETKIVFISFNITELRGGKDLKVTYSDAGGVAEFRAVPTTLCERRQAGRP